jgi:uncharacterized membrane protein
MVRILRPVRRVIAQGLAIVLPPLLTVVLLLWAWNIVDTYIMTPVEGIVRNVIVMASSDIRENSAILPEVEAMRQIGAENSQLRLRELESNPPTWHASDGTRLVQIGQQWIPRQVYDLVSAHPGQETLRTASDWYHRYVKLEHLPRHRVIPTFLIVFTLLLYTLGRLFGAGMGRLIWSGVESIVSRVPLVNKVYSSVKQVTDLAFTDTEFKYKRIVAVEYPSEGLWSLGFVVSDGFPAVQNVVGESSVAVLVPTSPMPATGFVVIVSRSKIVDLNISFDQAIQFLVSCGVVIPAGTLKSLSSEEPGNIGITDSGRPPNS